MANKDKKSFFKRLFCRKNNKNNYENKELENKIADEVTIEQMIDKEDVIE